MRLLSRQALAIALLVTLIQICMAAGPTNNRTPLTSVAATTDINAPDDPDDPGVGGGFDSENYFRTKLVDKLQSCTEQIESAVDAWVKKNSLNAPKKEVHPGRFLEHVTGSKLNGLFEVEYLVDTKSEKARVTVWFYKPDGTPLDPAGIKGMLETYAIADLEENLQAALLCGTKKS